MSFNKPRLYFWSIISMNVGFFGIQYTTATCLTCGKNGVWFKELNSARLDEAEVKYAPSVYDPIFTVTKTSDNQPKVELNTEVEGLDIYYSFDNSFPDRFYPKYTKGLIPPKDAVMLKVVTYKGKEQVGRFNLMPVEELRKRAGISK